ncbi:MAG: universal stress protein [Pirellulales bacterium]
MPERLLVAVDPSAASRKAVQYVGRIFGTRKPIDVEITLFHVADEPSQDVAASLTDTALIETVGAVLKDMTEPAAQRAEKLLTQCRDLLVAAGVPAEAIRIKHTLQESRPEARRVVAALAIVEEVKDGGYGTVVVGRRGTSNIPELYIGGVAEKVARHVTGATVWIVD